MDRIDSLNAELFRLPLPETLSDAMHGDHTSFELVTVEVGLESGIVGTGYTYTGGVGGRAILSMIEHDLAPHLIGRDGAAVESIYSGLLWYTHYVGMPIT